MAATKVVCQKIAEKQGFKLEFTDALIGGAALDACDDPFPDETYKTMVASDSVLLAAIGGAYVCVCVLCVCCVCVSKSVCVHVSPSLLPPQPWCEPP